MKIAVVGTGYVGLVTGTCFAETGVSVTCIDKDTKKVTQLSEGSIPIYEPGLESLIRTNIGKKRLFFTSDAGEGIKDSEVVFIAVGTPAGEDGSADLQHVINAARDIGRTMTSYMVIVTKSTVPVGTSEKVRKAIREELEKRKMKIDFDIASNPEFLKEGAAVEDFLRPERIVIGVDNEKTKKIMSRLYYSFVLNNHPIFFMNIASAEITKYAANAMLATRISFINEIANLCDILGADINEVRKGIGSDSRIGNKFLYPGTGYGGSSFPKDVNAIKKTADDHGYELNVIKAVEKANEYQKNVIFRKMMQFFKNDLRGKIFAIWGLSFKPKTDDIRESASIYLIERLLKEGAEIRVYDPAAMEETKKKLGNSITYVSDPYDAVQGVNALILMTEWPEFRLPDFYKMERIMKEKIIFDGRNIYDPGMLNNIGFIYFGIGRRQTF